MKPDRVVITEAMAIKYFGSENPVGKKLRIHNDTYYTVTGVVETWHIFVLMCLREWTGC